MLNISNIQISSLPFLTIGIHNNNEYIGMIGNIDNQFTSIYVFSDIMDSDLRKEFLDICEEWWWETNRQIPINIVLKSKWSKFKPYLKSFNTKEFQIISGPATSIDNLINKRIKRKQITIKRK